MKLSGREKRILAAAEQLRVASELAEMHRAGVTVASRKRDEAHGAVKAAEVRLREAEGEATRLQWELWRIVTEPA